jgi:hypothetical protein
MPNSMFILSLHKDDFGGDLMLEPQRGLMRAYQSRTSISACRSHRLAPAMEMTFKQEGHLSALRGALQIPFSTRLGVDVVLP